MYKQKSTPLRCALVVLLLWAVAGAGSALTISGVNAINITENSATIVWTTDIPSDSSVDYGLDTTYPLNSSNGDNTKTHSITLQGLLSDTTYCYQVTSTKNNDTATSGGYTLKTLRINTAPVAVNDAYSTDEDTVLNEAVPGVVGNDTDAESDPLTAELVDDVQHGTLSLSGDGSFSYNPDPDYNGSDSFTYRAYDGQDYSGAATVSITVNAVNDAPNAVNDSYSVAEGDTLNVTAPGVLGNDTDAENDSLNAVLVDDVQHGSLTLNSDGSFAYAPTVGYNGADGFTYLANDGEANGNMAAVSIAVTNVDHPMTVTLDSPADGSVSNFVNVTFQCSATDDDGLQTAALYLGDLDQTPVTVTFSGPTQTDDAMLLGDGGNENTNYGADTSVNIDQVNPLAHAVIRFNDIFGNDPVQVPPGSEIVSATLTVECFNPGDPLNAYRLIEDWVESEVTWNSRSTGVAWSNPGANGSGSHAGSAITMNFTSAGTKNLDVTQFVEEWNAGSPNYGIVLTNTYTDGVDFYSSEHPTEAYRPVLSVTYQPRTLVDTQPMSGASDTATFNQTLTDGSSYVWNCLVTDTDGNSSWAPADFQISVDASAPVISDVQVVDLSGKQARIVWSTGEASDSVVDYGLTDSYGLTEDDATLLTAHSITLSGLTPTTTYHYKVTSHDAAGNWSATVDNTFTTLENQPPNAGADYYSSNQNQPIVVNAPGVLGNDSDGDSDPITAILISDVAHGVLALNADGSFQYTPDNDFLGRDSFTYVANDGTQNSAEATVTIDIVEKRWFSFVSLCDPRPTTSGWAPLAEDLNEITNHVPAGWPSPEFIFYVGDEDAPSLTDWILYENASQPPVVDPEVAALCHVFVVGNHEIDDNSSIPDLYDLKDHYPIMEQYLPLDAQVTLNSASPTNDTMFMLEYQNAAFVILDTYYDESKGGWYDTSVTAGKLYDRVMDFADQALSATGCAAKFVFYHEPCYPDERHIGDSMDIDPRREEFWNLLTVRGVSATYTAHDHFSDVTDQFQGIIEADAGVSGGMAANTSYEGCSTLVYTLVTTSGLVLHHVAQSGGAAGSRDWTDPVYTEVGATSRTKVALVDSFAYHGANAEYWIDYATAQESTNPDWSSNNDGKWWESAFDPQSAGWQTGSLAIGYDTGGAWDWMNTTIDPDPSATGSPQVHAVFQRIPFEIPSSMWTAVFPGLELAYDCDDAVRIWLNGHEVFATDNAPAGNGFDQLATSARTARGANAAEPNRTAVNISEFQQYLTPGGNLLAVATWNSATDSSALASAVRLSLRNGIVLADTSRKHGTSLRYWVDRTGTGDDPTGWSDWWLEAFDPVSAGWAEGTLAVGYDSTDGTWPWINTEVDNSGGVHGVYGRIEFGIPSADWLTENDGLELGIDFDDGLRVWLNGTEVFAQNAPASNGFNQLAPSSLDASGDPSGRNHEPPQPVFQTVDISDMISLLHTGTNVLAFGNWNNQTDSNDLAAAVQLRLYKKIPLTAVRLVSFDAIEHDGGVSLEWTTGLEVDNIGFNVYREAGGLRTRLTPEMIAGAALYSSARNRTTAGRSYAWWDNRPGPAGTVQYWLEDIELSGRRTLHGPTVPVREPGRPIPAPSVLLSELDEATEAVEHARLAEGVPEAEDVLTPDTARISAEPVAYSEASPDQINTQIALAGQAAVKILVRDPGWYRIAQSDLLAAGLGPSVDPRLLRLYVNGDEVAIHVEGEADGVFDPEDSIELYGLGLDTAWTDSRNYWLIAGTEPGLRVGQTNATGRGLKTPPSFPYTVESKDRFIYFAPLKNGEKENYFGSVITPAPTDLSLTLTHLDPMPAEPATLEVVLQGVTEGLHAVSILLNGIPVGILQSQGQESGVLALTVSQALLTEGENVVTLQAQNGELDISVVDFVRITYWHTYAADNDALVFTASGKDQITVTGFSNPGIRLADITDPNKPSIMAGNVEPDGAGYSVTLKVPGKDTMTLLASTSDRLLAPAALVPNAMSQWMGTTNGADLAIIGYGNFLAQTASLRQLREAQGLSVATIDIEDLFDEFSFGFRSPHAIRDFLAVASSQWQTPPRFVLLVGDASIDPRDYLGMGDLDFVPVQYVPTNEIETVSDDWYVDFDEDGRPELAIGRLPVRTAEQAAAIVSKVVTYEQSAPGDWSQRVLLVSGQSSEDDFDGASRAVRSRIPEDLTVNQIQLSQMDPGTARSELLAQLEAGLLLVNFMGHGSVDIWENNLWETADAATLSNAPHTPYVVSMTCMNGFFHDLFGDCVAEGFLLAPQGGAVAVWASSGLTELQGQRDLDAAMMDALFAGGAKTIGEAAVAAKARTNDVEVRRTWVLFGDPATRVK